MPTDRDTRAGVSDPLIEKLQARRTEGFTGSISPIYLEPVVGGGERWTICIVVYQNPKQFRVINTIQREPAEQLFGSFGTGLFNIANQTANNLNDWLTQRPLSEWRPLFASTAIGNTKPVRTGSLANAVDIAIKSYATFMAKTINEPETVTINDDKSQRANKFELHVRNMVSFYAPHLNPLFGHQVSIQRRNTSFSYRFGFIGHHLAANFARLPSNNLSYAKRAAESNLMHLEQLRQHYSQKELIKPHSYELYVEIPSDNELPTQQTKDRILSALESLEAFGDTHEIQIVPMKNANTAVHRVLKSESPENLPDPNAWPSGPIDR